MTDERLLAWRQRHSRRRLARLRDELDRLSPVVLPRSPLGKAITYTLKNWTALNRYTEAAFLSIDNNHSERQIKQLVIGRNYAEPAIMRSGGPRTREFQADQREQLSIIRGFRGAAGACRLADSGFAWRPARPAC